MDNFNSYSLKGHQVSHHWQILFPVHFKLSLPLQIHRELSCPGAPLLFLAGSSLKARGERIFCDPTKIWLGSTFCLVTHVFLSCWMNLKCCQGILQFTAGRCRNYRISFLELVTMDICAHQNEDTLDKTPYSSFLHTSEQTPKHQCHFITF